MDEIIINGINCRELLWMESSVIVMWRIVGRVFLNLREFNKFMY